MNNIILDPEFKNGALVYGPAKPMTLVGKIKLTDSTERPNWLCTQWNSRSNINRIPLRIDENGSYIYENEYKTVARDPDGTLTLRVNASVEYTRIRKSKIDPWVHLYFEQRYSKPYSLAGMQKAPLKFSFCIPEFVDATPKGQMDPSVHAVIAVFYVILKDINEKSPTYGQFINFCVMLYDNRTGVTHESMFIDSGQTPVDATNMMIYTMDSSTYVDPVYADNKWHDIDIDLMPYFIHALEWTKQEGFLQECSLDDLSISSVFFGFEVPGYMDCEMKIRDLSLGLLQ